MTTTPGRRLDEAVAAGDMAGAAVAVYDLGRAAARRAVRARGGVPSHHPDVFVEADRKSGELLERFRVGGEDTEFPARPSAYVYVSVRRAVVAYLDAMEARQPLPSAIADAPYEVPAEEVYKDLMGVLVDSGDYEAAAMLAVALDVAVRGERPTARAIHAEIRRRSAHPSREDALWRVEKAWTRVRAAATEM